VKRSSAQAQVIVDLNENARILIGERKEPNDLIFNLPTTTNGCNKVLKNWVKSAGIEKKITWHCARHSLAVNLLRPDVGNSDIKTVAGILGHASIRSTEIYTHLVNELMKKAVNSLPKINL
jgi:site-specific recombinase XerD